MKKPSKVIDKRFDHPWRGWLKPLTEGSIWDRLSYVLGAFITFPVAMLMLIAAFFEDQEKKK